MRDLGYDFWEGGVAQALDPDKDDGWWRTQREDLARRPLPLRSCCGFIPGRFRLTGPKADPAPALDYAERALRRADEIGVKTVVFGSGGARNVPGDFTDIPHAPDTEQGARQYAAFCREIVRRISDLGTVQVAIEPLRPRESNIVNYVFQGLAICTEVNSPRLGQLADVFHMMMGGDETSVLTSPAAQKWLNHVHVAEFGTRMFPGHDPAQVERLRPYFRALASSGYSGGVSCECGWGDRKDLAANLKTALGTMKGLA